MEPARLLRSCKPGMQAWMDCGTRSPGPGSYKLWTLVLLWVKDKKWKIAIKMHITFKDFVFWPFFFVFQGSLVSSYDWLRGWECRASAAKGWEGVRAELPHPPELFWSVLIWSLREWKAWMHKLWKDLKSCSCTRRRPGQTYNFCNYLYIVTALTRTHKPHSEYLKKKVINFF